MDISPFPGLLPLICLLIAPIHGLSCQWRVEAWFGDAYNLGTPLTIEQEGEPDLHINADWSTRPWRPTWYYSGRIAKWSGNSAWAFEYMHHKLYLDNPPPEVATFRITNGINNLLVERHWRRGGWEFGVGGGPAWAVPLSRVRDKTYSRGGGGIFKSHYELSGATALATVARRLKLFPYTYGSFAIKTTFTHLDVNIADGRAHLNNVALHLQYGISLQSSP
ncbi:MAG: hypothetical protein ABI542_05965 [Gemmatimonadota bacterium]